MVPEYTSDPKQINITKHIGNVNHNKVEVAVAVAVAVEVVQNQEVAISN